MKLDLTSSFEKEFDKLYSKIDQKIKETSKKMSIDLSASNMTSVQTTAKNVLKVVQSIGENGSIKKTTTYLDELGNKCKEVEVNGQLVSKSITEIGQRAKDIQTFNMTLSDTKDLLKEKYNIQIKMLALDSKSPEYTKASEELETTEKAIEQNKE